MAEMGTRGITHAKKKARKPSEPQFHWLPTTCVNLIVSPVQIQPISTLALGVEPRGVGMPIMREGFITETGFLPTAD